MPLDGNLKKILIVDFGSQFTQLIARKIRELGVYCEIISHNKLKKIKNFETNIKGLVFSGGPLNVYENKKVKFNNKLLKLGVPVLGICFGHQIISKELGGRVKSSKYREFGLAEVQEIKKSKLEPEQIILICFKAEVVKSFKENLPYHKAFWLSGFKKDKKGAWNPSIESVLATIKSCKADGLDSQHTIPNEFSKAVLDAGYEWHAWTINDVPIAKRLVNRGIYSITTDRPKLIASGLGK